MNIILNSKGFTLIETMITLAVSLLLGIAATMAYQTQIKSYTRQEAVSFAQQSLKACQIILGDDLRLAGYNPSNSGATFNSVTSVNNNAHTVYLPANGPNLTLSYWDDLTNSQQTVSYGLYNYAGLCGGADPSLDLGRTSFVGAAPPNLLNVTFPVAENIVALEFMYTMENSNGVDTVSLLNPSPAATRLADIKSVTISLLSQAHRMTPDTTDLNTYTTPFGTTWGPFNDGFKRRLQSFTISLRN